MLDVCLLGTGGVLPLPKRWLTSLLLRINGKMILIDCGEGTQIPIAMSGWGFKQIDAILLTHYHADHVAGLAGLLLTMGNAGKTAPLTIIGPQGLGRVIGALTVIAPQLPFDICIGELAEGIAAQIELCGVTVKAMPVDHSIACFAYLAEVKRQGRFDAAKAKEQNIPVGYWKRLQSGETVKTEEGEIKPEAVIGAPRRGIKVCYCTDTRPTEPLITLAKDADLLVCEGMYGEDACLEDAVSKKHMLFSEAAAIARDAHAKTLWLTHYSPALVRPEEHIENAKRIFENTVAGKDLMTTTIRFEDET